MKRMPSLVAFAMVLAYLSGAGAAPVRYELDPEHSDVGFVVKHMMVSRVRGKFHKVSGVLNWDEKDAAKSSLEVTVGVESIDTGVEKRDNHLRSADFFDASKFPTITFKSTKVKSKGKKLEVQGELTIRDVTKPVTLSVEGPEKPAVDPYHLTRTGAVATGKINRKDFGLQWNAALETGGVAVSEEVALEISAEFVKKDATTPSTKEANAQEAEGKGGPPPQAVGADKK